MHTNRQDDFAPTYQGRPLARPDEEVVDQGLAFDVVTLLNRRQLLRTFGLGVTVLGLAACEAGSDGGTGAGSSGSPAASGTARTSSGEIPDETAGPFPGDGSNGPDALAESGIVRSDIRSSFGEASGMAEGVPMRLELAIHNLAGGGAPYQGVAVYVWHCDREGRYSMYSDGVQDQNYLRGVQIAGPDGRVRFASVFPACYQGRWPHIHFEVYPDEAAITDVSSVLATSQVALPEQACRQVYAESGYEASVENLSRVSLESDTVFGDDGGVSQLATVTGGVRGGFTVSLDVGVDPTTTPSAGHRPR